MTANSNLLYRSGENVNVFSLFLLRYGAGWAGRNAASAFDTRIGIDFGYASAHDDGFNRTTPDARLTTYARSRINYRFCHKNLLLSVIP